MSNRRSTIYGLRRSAGLAALLSLKLAAGLAFAQQAPPRDPAEPPPGKPQVKSLPRPASAIRRQSIDEKSRSEEHTSELQSHSDLVCRLLLEKKKKQKRHQQINRRGE